MKLEQVQSHKDLIVWQKAIDLVEDIYEVTAKLPSDERYGLVSQMRRAAVSIPSNIAEGHRRSSNKDSLRFMNIAYASGAELETHIEIIKRLKYRTSENAESLLEEVVKMLNKICSKAF
ncbi:four helix bundle protein [Candidatus Uhrbacteria bacterium]|jgi:four helix bundle protein|nr:four helix bundle protein [Candidatus Uhrbacteria bacterium]MBT7717515.1 four helix bundle protein [Candidatus Uhrbacteria bacterium]